MSRTSPVHYIAPSAISLIPNANGSANDIAVHIASGTKIKVYCRTLGIDMVNATFQEWAIAGKNRRLANENVPYTIYARLPKTDKGKGYLIFAPKLQVDDKWTDKYCYITPNGMSSEGTADDSNWYVKIGDVSEVDNAQRILDLDTGILGTDQYNSEWNLNPDDFPLRVEIDCTINDEPAGSYPYVRWSEQVRLSARLLQGFAAATDLSQVDHWGIYKNLGEQAPELAPTPDWPDAQRKELFQTTGDITLYHSRDGVDDFDGAEACIFTVVAWGAPADATELDGGNPSYVQKAIATVTLHAETYEVLSSEDIPDEPEDFVPSDTTLFTGAAMDAYMKRYPHYFRKDQPDTDPHLASFGDLHVKKNLSTDPEDPTALSGGNMLVEGNAQVDGNAELKGDVKIGASASNKAIVNAVMQVLAQMKSQNYVDDNPLGKGGWNLLSADANGNSYFVIDKLFVRLKAIFNELEIRKISYAGGNIIFSHAGSEIVGVKPLYRNGSIYAYRCYCKKDDGTTATKNWWKEDDQAKCQTFNIEEGVHQNVKNTYYWRMVVAVGSERAFLDGTTSEELYNYVDLSLGDCDANSDIPKAGDSIIQMGNRTDTGRQGFISLEVFGSDAPAIKVYKGVNGYVLDDKRPIIISPKNTSMRVQHYEIETDYGVFPAVKERGDWDLIDEHKCYYFDRVQHNGSSWLCTYPQGSTPEYTTEEPSVNATYWKVDAQAGESAPSYTEEWYAWSNVQSVVNATTEPTPNGGWNQVIGGQGAYAYLWKKITRYTWNSATRVYVAGTSQYFRMSGTNGTSIDINGEVALHTDMEANGYVTPVGGTRHIADDGESYVLQEDWTDSEGVNRQGHLFMWSAEGTKWVPLGKFQGEDGKTFYTHVAWATSVTTNPSTGEVTNVTGFTIAKTADDTTHLWMGVYVDENSAADPADALLYTWSYTKGNKGDSITVDERNSKTEYVVSNQGTSAPASGWSTTIPSVPQGQFLWTRVTTAYSDGSSTTSYGVSYNAEDGTPGTSITITSKSVKYAVTNNGTQPADSSFSYNSIPPLELGQYLWTKTEVAYSDGNSTKAYSVSRLGTDGEDGQTGADGYTTHFAYATSADGSQGFSTTNFNGATYIGTYRDQNATDSTNYRDYTWTEWKGDKGEKGDKGDSITIDTQNSKTEYVASNQGTSAPSSGWSTTIPSVPQGQYLWTRVTTVYSDGSSTVSYGVSYNAEDGTDGEDGTSVTITSKSVKYAVTNNGTQPADSSFSYNSIPPLELGQYLWTKTEVAYSDGNSTKAYSVSRLGTDGEDGQTGADGYTTHFAYATSADGSQGFSTTNFNGATYIGTYRDQNATDSTNYQDYTWTPWRGEKGDDAAALILSSSAVFIRTNNEGAVLDDFAREITLTMRTHSKELSLKSVDFTQSPNISDGASVLTTEGLVRSVMGSLVYLRNSGNSVSDNLLTITPTSHSIAPTSIVVTADKDSVLEEQTISFTATAVDEDGNEYTGYASMLIQRQYVAADGINGEDGEDGVSVYLENPAALFAQDVSNTSTITPLPSKTNIIVKRGNTTVPLTDYTVAKPSSGLDDTHCTYSVANTSTEKSVTISAIGTYAEGGNNYYYENGFARVNVTYEGTTYVLDYKFLLNAIGKFKRVVEGDVETSIASKKYYEYNPATGQYDKETTMGEFVRSSSKNTSVLTETKNDTISAMSEVLQKVDNISLTVYENKDGIDLFTHTDDVVVGTSWTTIPTTSNTTNCKTMCVSIPMEIEKKSADSTINFRIYTKNTSAGATIDTIIQSCTFNNGVLTSTGNKSRFNAITSYVRDSKEYVKGVLYFEKTQSSTFKMVDVGARNTGTTVSCTLFKSRKFSVGVSLKDGLIGTGIDIVNGKITNTADQWECQNNSGVKTAWLDDMGNFTVRGVYNNLITVIDENTWDKYIISHTENGVTEWYLDALLCGTFVELKYLPPSFSGMLNLPFYANDVIQKRGYTRYLNSSLSTPRLMTDNELRMLAGRKMVFRWDESIGGNSDTLGYIYAPQAYWGVNETAVTIAQVEARLQALMHGDKHFITLGSTWAAASAYNRSPSLEAPKTVFLSFELVKFHARQTNSYYSWGYIWMASEDGSTAAKDDINWD